MQDLLYKYVRVFKVSDDRFSGSHPGGIQAGYSAEGWVVSVEPVLYMEGPTSFFHTSAIQGFNKIDDLHYSLKTLNSSYTVEVLPEVEPFPLKPKN